jgi:hypothetical protein
MTLPSRKLSLLIFTILFVILIFMPRLQIASYLGVDPVYFGAGCLVFAILALIFGFKKGIFEQTEK